MMHKKSEQSLWGQFYDAICILSVFAGVLAVYLCFSDLCKPRGLNIDCGNDLITFFAVSFNPATLFLLICMSVIMIFSANFIKAFLIIFFGTSLLFCMVRGFFLIIGLMFSKLFGGFTNTSENYYEDLENKKDKEF